MRRRTGNDRIEYSKTAAVDGFTIDELEQFCAAARAKGIPGSVVPRVWLKGATRIRTLTAAFETPPEASS